MKTLILFLMALTLFSGCTRTIYIKDECPRIKVPARVNDIWVNVNNGCICDGNVTNIFNGIDKLRATEAYCRDALLDYNKEFAK